MPCSPPSPIFADLKSPWIRGHSRTVASLAGRRVATPGSTAPPATTCGGRARPRPRPGRRRERDLGQAWSADDLGVGAGPAASRLHGADSRSLPVTPATGWTASSHHERVDGSVGRRALVCRSPVPACSHPGRGGRVRRAHLLTGRIVLSRVRRSGTHARSEARVTSTQTRSPACSAAAGLRSTRRADRVAGRPHRPGSAGAPPDRDGLGRTARTADAPLDLAEDCGRHVENAVREDRRLGRELQPSSRWSTTSSSSRRKWVVRPMRAARSGRILGACPRSASTACRSTTRSTVTASRFCASTGPGARPCSGGMRLPSWGSAVARSSMTGAASRAASARSRSSRTCTCKRTTPRR